MKFKYGMLGMEARLSQTQECRPRNHECRQLEEAAVLFIITTPSKQLFPSVSWRVVAGCVSAKLAKISFFWDLKEYILFGRWLLAPDQRLNLLQWLK